LIISADVMAPPTARFLTSHPAHFIALGFGTGLAPAMPGTVGTLLAFPLYWVLARDASMPAILVTIAAGFALGVWACARTGRDLSAPDHGSMVWDEVIAFMLVLAFCPQGHYWSLGAFVLFRAFDILKPPPIRYFDRRLKGGFGVMFDDILAAFYTLIVIAIASKVIA
jgi:phosphatidylglycerophosphatase A